MAKNDILTQAEVRQILNYDPDTGVFLWKRREDVGAKWNGKWAGKVAGHSSVKGHVVIMVNKQRYFAHRLAWVYATGEYPDGDIDHKNGVKNDNRLCNLRPATRTQNITNSPVRKDSSTGVKGVYRHRGKFVAQTRKNGQHYYIGAFKTLEDAKAAHADFYEKLHGEFARIK